MIRGRPPVSTLYETVLFVTAVGSLVALAAEWINRERLAISAAAILGMVGLFIANGYETLDKQDTMPSLVAVLDTNFWLATHVTSITVGYSAGMLAALLATIYLVARTLRIRRSDRAFYKSLARMVYGVLAFALIFSTVGTILGGIWANYSWGRFWGWDPKENGALLICLSQIAILHGRMGGYLKDHGLCMAAAFAGTIVAFSWWGVNLLGVGLHSYGFTSGIHTALWTYYGVQWGVVGLGGVTWLLDRRTQTSPGSGAVVDTRSRKREAGRGREEPSPVIPSSRQDGLAPEA
jgi:ABC-type transport system involved in cytochrome c biogenesis permease subunit